MTVVRLLLGLTLLLPVGTATSGDASAFSPVATASSSSIATASGSSAKTRNPTFRGRASWFAAPTGTAAAGPALRRALGRHWLGRVVTVRANGHSVRVKLTGWCQCLAGTKGERLLDLGIGTFARFARPSRGLVKVTVRI